MSSYDKDMYNPLEEFLKKTIFLMALGFWISTTDSFKAAMHLIEEDHKVLQETRASYDKSDTSAKSDLVKVDVKSNTR